MALKRHIPAATRHRLDRRARAGMPKPCEVRIPGVHDPNAPVEYHHRRMFSRGGRHTYANLVVTCQPCHRWIHGKGNTRQAITLDLLRITHPRRYWRRHEHNLEDTPTP